MDDEQAPGRTLTARELVDRYATGERDFNLRFENGNAIVADLKDADLRGATLEGINLEGANLEGANLEGANLRRANLQAANLEAANLEAANLEAANLEVRGTAIVITETGASRSPGSVDGDRSEATRTVGLLGGLGVVLRAAA